MRIVCAPGQPAARTDLHRMIPYPLHGPLIFTTLPLVPSSTAAESHPIAIASPSLTSQPQRLEDPTRELLVVPRVALDPVELDTVDEEQRDFHDEDLEADDKFWRERFVNGGGTRVMAWCIRCRR